MPDLADARAQPNPVLGFRVTPKLLADIERVARAEGISKADAARRAVIRDLAAKPKHKSQAA